MAFVAPRLTDEQALLLLAHVYQACQDTRLFVLVMSFLLGNNLFRLRLPPAIVDHDNYFADTMDDATSRFLYRFTIPQLRCVCRALHLPDTITTTARDRVSTLEAMALVCRRMAEPCRLYNVANEFGRSLGATSRIFHAMIALVHSMYSDTLYLNEKLLMQRFRLYAESVRRAGSPLATCFAFIDGTKHYISRPGARAGANEFENLQRACYNGHPRRHCLNWQGVTAPDGIVLSMYGPVEGRRHDSTLLAMSGLLETLELIPDMKGYLLYGDPAYGCRENLSSFPNAAHGSHEAEFNSAMSSVRESVEWSFHIIKGLWSFLNWSIKQKVREAPIGKVWLVATLLTNCHTCLQPSGNQISMYFGCNPPSVEEYLNGFE